MESDKPDWPSVFGGRAKLALRFLLQWLIESIGATYISTLIWFVAAVLVGFFTGGIEWPSPVSFTLRLLMPAAAGFLVASVMRSQLSKASYFVWMIPCVLFLRAMREVMNGPYVPPYSSQPNVWNAMIGEDCGDSECLYQLLYTSPLICAISYSVSSGIIRAFEQRRIAEAPKSTA